MPKIKSSRIRINKIKPVKSKTSNCYQDKIRKEAQKTIETKILISGSQINAFLKCRPHFIGCYAEDELSSLSIHSFPCFLIVNIDQKHMKGSHWIALGIFRQTIEIIDPLGFKLFNWGRIPCHLLNFLHIMSQSREISIMKPIQSDQSILCAYFCISYIINRKSQSLNQFQNRFSNDLDKNDSILINSFH